MARLLITGGAGTLGRVLARRALDRSWTVRATAWRRPLDLPRDVETVHADVRDPGAVAVAMRDVDAVVHTAYRQGEDEWSTNVNGSDVVARAAAGAGARLVHLSTDLVFDGRRGRYTEDDETGPVSSYGRSKLAAEERVAAASPAATLVRTSLIYGTPRGPQERLAREGRRFFVDERRSPVHVDDLADALLELLGLDAPGPLHVAGADDVSRYEFALLLGAEPGRIEQAHTTPDRAPDVTLDSTRAQSLLDTRLRGVYEVLDSNASVRSAR
jgi:dTDP-4-dehydrorhamnose reductase